MTVEALPEHEALDVIDRLVLAPPDAPRLGNPDVPVYAAADTIADTIVNNQCTVLVGYTGSGKSTQIGQIGLNAGFERVVVTQPRIVAARSLSERVADEVSEIWGKEARAIVGYRTAEEGNTTEHTRLEFCTDGLELMRMLNGNGVTTGELLVVDEAHEGNPNMEALLYLARERMKVDPTFRVVIMSATINSSEFAEYMSDGGANVVPVIEVEGRMHPVEERDGGYAVEEAVAAAKQGLNTQIFVPGKRDVEKTIAALQKELGSDVVILPLHGDLTVAEQQKIFATYEGPIVVVSTSIGQTSLTVPGLDVVIDTCLEKTGMADVEDVEGLYEQLASQSTRDQRRGRVGRTKPGIYIRATLEGRVPILAEDLAGQIDVPPVQCTRPDSLLLKLGQAGIALDDADLMHNPTEKRILAARNRLARIGAVVLGTGQLTEIGRHMSELPLDTPQARMLVEALGKTQRIAVQMAAAAAILQVRGIVSRSTGSSGWHRLTSESRSDILAELDVLVSLYNRSDDDLARHSVVTRRARKAQQLFERLCEMERLDAALLSIPSETERLELINCIAEGIDGLMVAKSYNTYADRHGRLRKLQQDSVIPPGLILVLGGAFDQRPGKGVTGKHKRQIVGATALRTIKDLIAAGNSRLYYVPDGFTMQDGEPHARLRTHFDSVDTGMVELEPARGTHELHVFMLNDALSNQNASDLPSNIAHIRNVFLELVRWQKRSLHPLNIDDIADNIVHRATRFVPDGVTDLDEIDAYLTPISVADYISPEAMDRIRRTSPETTTIAGIEASVEYIGRQRAVITVPRELWGRLPKKSALPTGWQVLIRHEYDPYAHSIEHARAIGVAQSRYYRRRTAAKQRSTQPAPAWATLSRPYTLRPINPTAARTA